MLILLMFATGNPEGLDAELLETLVKMAPTKEEEIKLRDYKGDISKLGSAERFLKTVLDIPFAFKRVEAMLYRANFDTEVKYLRKTFETLEVIFLYKPTAQFLLNEIMHTNHVLQSKSLDFFLTLLFSQELLSTNSKQQKLT